MATIGVAALAIMPAAFARGHGGCHGGSWGGCWYRGGFGFGYSGCGWGVSLGLGWPGYYGGCGYYSYAPVYARPLYVAPVYVAPVSTTAAYARPVYTTPVYRTVAYPVNPDRPAVAAVSTAPEVSASATRGYVPVRAATYTADSGGPAQAPSPATRTPTQTAKTWTPASARTAGPTYHWTTPPGTDPR